MTSNAAPPPFDDLIKRIVQTLDDVKGLSRNFIQAGSKYPEWPTQNILSRLNWLDHLLTQASLVSRKIREDEMCKDLLDKHYAEFGESTDVP